MNVGNSPAPTRKVFWPSVPRPGNLGDILTPWFMLRSGVYPTWVDKHSAGKILGVGSIARWAQEGDDVWGCGIFFRDDRLNPGARYHCVRGPLTRERVIECGGDCPNVLGDPVLLLPRFLNATGIPKNFELGVVPHYVDQRVVADMKFPPRTTVINVLNARPELVIAHICQCKRIISSSLHGIITAHAYGIPARWVRFSDQLDGDDVKFFDYFLSVGIVPYEPVMPDDVAAAAFDPVKLTVDLDAIWAARPWRDSENSQSGHQGRFT